MRKKFVKLLPKVSKNLKYLTEEPNSVCNFAASLGSANQSQMK